MAFVNVSPLALAQGRSWHCAGVPVGLTADLLIDTIDLLPTWARHALCGAATCGTGKLTLQFSKADETKGVALCSGHSQNGYTVDFDIKWPRPRRDVNKDPGWGINGKVRRIDFVKLLEMSALGGAVDVALDDTVQG